MEPQPAGSLRMTSDLGAYQPVIASALAEMIDHEVGRRIWDLDHTVWQPRPDQIDNRLGWLSAPASYRSRADDIAALATGLLADDIQDVLLIGMGGSSLAPAVFAQVFAGAGDARLSVLDSTHPEAVLAKADAIDPERTLCIVATKSGTTVETMSLARFFFNRFAGGLGRRQAGKRFVAITDPGSPLQAAAEKLRFREVVLNEPDIGGRYSVLSSFGLLPAALVGVDIGELLERATEMVRSCGPSVSPVDNPGIRLGGIFGEMTRLKRNKVTFLVSPGIGSFAAWLEQLIAESTGKDGTGIVPVVHEPLGKAADYGDDRVFISLQLADDEPAPALLDELTALGHPAIRLRIRDRLDLGGQFFLWEMATAVSAHRLGINPFNQPDVESSKQFARQSVEQYASSGHLPGEVPSLRDGDMDVYGDVGARNASDAVRRFVARGRPGDYVAIQAFANPTPGTDSALANLRTAIRDLSGLATTCGYGPRYLHSTGQLHKGDRGRGLMLQLTTTPTRDAPVPDDFLSDDSSLSFGVLLAAQALGDRQALLSLKRRVLRVHLGADPEPAILSLCE